VLIAVGWVADVTSLVHTFPFIVMNIREGMMRMSWATSSFYWTGVAALVPQVCVRGPVTWKGFLTMVGITDVPHRSVLGNIPEPVLRNIQKVCPSPLTDQLGHR
jgi:hypothetical protein